MKQSRATKVAISAMILLGTGLLFFLLLPEAKSLSLLILIFGMGAMLIPFVMMSKPENTTARCDPNGCDGRSISCCSGPGTVGSLSKKRPQPTHTTYTTDPSDPFVVGKITGPEAFEPDAD